MAESGQRSEASSAVRSPSPAPRKKVTVSLTAAQAAELRVLWQEHSAALHAMLAGWCGNGQNASDVLQEVFRRLAESPSIMGKMKNARAFLAVSARRLAVDFSRRSATRVAYQAAAGIEVPIAHNPGPTDENLRMAIRSTLDSLPTEQRAVFDHKMLKGRTLEEISKIEAISLNTAASRLRYALDKIREQLRPYYDDLNRHQFKKMKTDLLTDESNHTKRIITRLEPKRVPSVLPGLEGLAALSADDGNADAPDQVEFTALPAVEGPAPDQVDLEPQVHIDPVFDAPIAVEGPASDQVDLEPQVHIDPGFVAPIAVSFEPTTEDHSFETNVEEPFVSDMVIEEPFVSDMGETEWPEDFMTGIFEGSIDSTDSGGDPVPFDLENGFEICVLPVACDFVSPDADTDYSSLFDSNRLLADYTSFLS
ncbi:MAG: sigma-70 family RNA polymerase sigma factor, partial [Chthoniobacterales bacterium]|nr:sigma-70 family RNA polymerase sigma factor [Chthoniobacterales bacterium]